MTIEDYPKRSDYLNNINTLNFIEWLEFRVDSPESLKHQYYLKKENRDWSSTCLYDAYEKYLWSYNRNCPAMGKQVAGRDFTESFKYLTELAEMFRTALTDNRVELAHNCALAMLGWGGVLPHNRERIKGMGEKICDNLKEVQKRLNLSDVCLGNHDNIYINAGFTKLYFLLIDDFIMYDGRVGAALGLLGRMYAEENCLAKIPEEIEFSFGNGKTSESEQKSKNRRDPSKGQYRLPNFTGKPNRHLNDNIKASWLLKELANRNTRFAKLSQNLPLNERLTAIQSALFMIGYDVRQI